MARVEQGWISAPAPDDAFSEAVIVHYDPEVITAAQLILVHLRTHAATKDHGLRHRYRSAIYAFDPADELVFAEILAELRPAFPEPLVTRVLPYVAFRESLPEHLDYYRTDPERPFCRRYIAPKLEYLRGAFGELMG